MVIQPVCFFCDWWEMRVEILLGFFLWLVGEERRVVILPGFFSVIDGRGEESGDPTGLFFL